MATINSARHFGFKHKGAVAPGYAADLVVLENLTDFSVRAVFKNGRRHEETVSQPSGSLPASVTGRVRIRPLQETSFAIACPSGQARIIGVTGGDLNTKSLIESVVVDKAGFVDVAACRDLVKVAVVERHHASGNVGLSLVKGLLHPVDDSMARWPPQSRMTHTTSSSQATTTPLCSLPSMR